MGIIARQSIKGTVVTYIGVALGFLTTFFVLTRFLTTEEIGLARVLVDAATLFVGLAQLGTSASIIRFYPYFRDKQPGNRLTDNGFWFWTLLVPFVGFLLFTLVYCCCHVPISAWFAEKSPLFVNYYYFVVPLALCMLYQTVFETSSNVLMRIVVPRAVREILVRVGLLGAYLAYAFRLISMDGFVIVLTLVYALAAIANCIYLFAYGRMSIRPDWAFLRANRSLVRNYLFYTLFLIVSAVASVLAPMLSSFFITAQMGLGFTGIYAIATYMAVMVSVPYRSLTAIASPQLAEAIKQQDRPQVSLLMQQVSSNTLLVGEIIFLTMWLNIDLIFHLLPNGETYAVARNVVFWLGISQLIMATCSICLTALNYSRFYVLALVHSFVLTISAILLNNYLIPLWGMEGAALSNLLSYLLYFVLIIVTLVACTHTRPFSRSHGISLLLMLAALAIDYLWQTYLPISSIWISSIVRSLVILGSVIIIAYKAKLSPEINALLHKILLLRH